MPTSTVAQLEGVGKHSTDVKAVLNQVVGKLLPMAVQHVDERQLQECVTGLKQLNAGLFRLVIMGEIKKGKSSFINALLGQEGLLPTDSDIATSTVFKIIYGPERKFKVFLLPDAETGAVLKPLEIREDQVNEYGTESGNPNNKHRVDFIAIELPHPLLATGLVIVDTPGIGGLYKAHREVTWRYAPKADAILFVVDSVESPIGRDEVEFLKDLTSKFTKRVFFVQTKTDAVGKEQVDQWQQRNLQVIARRAEDANGADRLLPGQRAPQAQRGRSID